jgi:mannose-6-phosphate isomerase-like protein (cupin superfamily)
VHEVGAREPEAVLQGVPQPPALDEHGRHRKPDEREPGEREKVDAGEDGHARRCQGQERDSAGEQRSTSRPLRDRRHLDGPHVAERERERADDDSPTDANPSVEERGSDRESRRRDPETEPAPEPVPVELDRVADQLADGALGRNHLGGLGRHAAQGIPCKDLRMGYAVFPAGEQIFSPPSGGDPNRSILRLSDSLGQTRANIWRYPPGSRGRRHVERVQEEVFVVVEGTATLYLDDPPEAFELPRGSVAVVEAGTAVQVANLGNEDMAVFIVGAPPEQAGADYLPDAG